MHKHCGLFCAGQSSGLTLRTFQSDKHLESFLRLMGDEELWLSDERFRSMASRTRHIDAVYAYVEQQPARKDTATWVRLLAEADIPVAPVAQLSELIETLEQGNLIGRYRDAQGQSYRGINPSARWRQGPSWASIPSRCWRSGRRFPRPRKLHPSKGLSRLVDESPAHGRPGPSFTRP